MGNTAATDIGLAFNGVWLVISYYSKQYYGKLTVTAAFAWTGTASNPITLYQAINNVFGFYYKLRDRNV